MCTSVRFTDDKGNMYFGHNLDWTVGYGEKVVITPKNYQLKTAFVGNTKPKWPIIGMGIIAEDTPLYFDCANTAGLGIAGLNFPGYAKYETAAVEGKTNVAAYEFPLWVAMNFASVDDAEKALRSVAIVDKPINDKFPSSLFHWIIADEKRSIVVEYTSRGMEIFENDLDCLTNQPGYNWHHENIRNYLNLTSKFPEKVMWSSAEFKPFGSGSLQRGLPGDYTSTSRFVRVAYLNANYPKQDDENANISRLFHTLTGVAMIDGAAAMDGGQFEKTIYTGGYSAATQTYYYSTYENPAIQSVALRDYDTNGVKLIAV